MHIEISKVELSSRIFPKWEYIMTESGRKTKIKASADSPIHDDLSDAMQGLVPHFVLVTEMKKKPEVAKVIDLKQLPEKLLSKYKVTGIVIDDNKGDISYKISGFKILNTGRTVGFETPKINEVTSEEDQYEFIDELISQVELIKEEMLEYMQGKEAKRQQTSMEFEEGFNPESDESKEGEQKEEFTETAA